MPEEDRAWVEEARRGDRAAMERLFDLHRKLVFAVGLSICGNATDADEVTQETFLRAFRRLSEWRGESKFSTWLYTIASRVALDWKTRFLRRPRAEREGVAESEPGKAEETERLLAAIQALPLQQRLALTLRHFKAMAIAEIAEAQGCAVGTVKANLHHAIVKLREMLAPDLP